MTPKSSEFCHSCGAPLVDAPGAVGTDAAVYPKLAQANLLRMRKQLHDAQDICLGILRQYPNHLAANILLGDISVEEGDLDQAVEWYELALDIDRDSPVIAEKLRAVRDQKDMKQEASTVETLGLPAHKPKTALYGTIAVVAILAVGGLAYWLSTQNHGGAQKENPNKPLVVGATDSGTTGTPDTNVSEPAKNTKTDGTSGSSISSEDKELTKTLTDGNDGVKDGAYVIDARYDLASDGITVTYFVPEDKDERGIGASIASDSFGLVKDKLSREIGVVSLRAMRDSKQFYSATMRKSDLDATKSDEWLGVHKGDQKAFLKTVLSNEKYAEAPATTAGATGGGGGEAGGTSAGDTAGTAGTTGAEPSKPEPAKPDAKGQGSTGTQ